MGRDFEFHIEEYKMLCQEKGRIIKEATVYAQYSLITSAAIISWLAAFSSDSHLPFRAIGWWIPLVLCIFASFRALRLTARMILIRSYLQKIECKFAAEDLSGWETFLSRRRQVYIITTGAAAALFWIIVIVSMAAVGYFGYSGTYLQKP